jgi:PPOX class probable F420-dependent enzyme
MREQRRAKRIAMTPEERDRFLDAQRTCRIATVGADGSPHVSALWYVWDGSTLWLNSLVKSQRWTNLMRDPRVSVLVDGGEGYFELCGIELIGRVEPVGEAPRGSDPVAALEEPEGLWGAKYTGGSYASDGKHAWVRLVPDKIVSWDFKKLASLAE